MPKITYVSHEGVTRTVEVKVGLSVMEGAVRNDVPGIDAECGGACACATCHVFVDPAWADKLEPPSDMERSMVAFAEGAKPSSRLSCQIRVTPELDGLAVTTPERQNSAL